MTKLKLTSMLIYLFVFLLAQVQAEFLLESELAEKPMVVIIPSYNNVEWCQANLDSVLMQKYSNYRVIYINDCSQDGTQQAVESYIKQHSVDYHVLNFNNQHASIAEMLADFIKQINAEPHFFILVNNAMRCGALENLYKAIHSCKNDEICITLDGDDWLAHGKVLKQLNTLYAGEVWLTHGTIKEYPTGHVSWSEPVSEQAIQNNSYRKFKCAGHLRTFYAWLFKKIELQDLLWQDKFFPMTWDMAMMYPMCEMAAERHTFIPEVNMIYNMANALNDNKVNAQLQRDLDHYIRNKPPYTRLEEVEMDFNK